MFSSAGYKLLMYKVYVTASGAPDAADFFQLQYTVSIGRLA